MMTLTSRRSSALTLLAALSAGALVAAQSQTPQTPPVFRAEANLVEVIVRVTDAKGQFVPGLTVKDFQLREQGRPQTLVAFDHVNLPREPVRTAAAGTPVLAAPDMSTVATNERAREARLFVLLLDDMLTSRELTIPVRTIAREFVERHVQPADWVAVLSTTGRNVLTQDFSGDKTRALATIDRYMGMVCPEGPRGRAEDEYNTLVALDFLETLAAHLGGVRGRRVSVLWISEGLGIAIDGAGFRPAPRQDASPQTADMSTLVAPRSMDLAIGMRDALDAFRRANVTLYGIDPRRLGGDGCQGTPLAPIPARYSRSIDSLRNFSDQTGGFAAVSVNDFRDAFERIVDENSQYYVLGYQPASRGRDGDFRRIQVTVPGRRDVRISARPGYVVSAAPTTVAGPPGVPPALAAPIVSNVPTAGLPLRVQAIPRRGTTGAARVQVVIEVPGRELRYTEVDGRARGQVRFALRVIDDRARARHDLTHALDLNLSADDAQRLVRAGVRWLPTVDLPPGHYSLRVSGEVAGTTAVGSVFADIDVPKFEDDESCPPLLPELCGLWVGGLAVTSLPASLFVTHGTSPLALNLPTPPTTARTFMLGDVLTVSADVATPRRFRHGTMRLTVHAQAAQPEDSSLWDDATVLADRADAHRVRSWTVNTDALGPGRFILRLAVFDNGDRTAETTMLFEVVEQQVQSLPATP
jgi:VWFA-related protein